MDKINSFSLPNLYSTASLNQSKISPLKGLEEWQRYELKFENDSRISLTPLDRNDYLSEVILEKSDGIFTLRFLSNDFFFKDFLDRNHIVLGKHSKTSLWEANGRYSLIVKDLGECQRLFKALLARCSIESKELNIKKYNSLCEKFNSFIVPVTGSEKFLYRFLDLPVDDLYSS